MKSFRLNNDIWKVKFVSPHSDFLVDRTNRLTIGTTDPVTMSVYISDSLSYEMLRKVLIHEIGHCALISFNLLPILHKVVKPDYWISAEEWLCNFISDYGMIICNAANYVLLDDIIETVPREYERLIS